MKLKSFVILCFVKFVVAIEIQNEGTSREARKLFGGYKITPRYCKPSRQTSENLKGPNICMFNHECIQRNGIVVGACMDGFLFGACCQLPEDHGVGDLINSDSNTAVKPQDNNLYAVPFTRTPPKPTVSSLGSLNNDITLSGVSQIASTLLNQPILPTAQDDTMVQFDKGDQFTTTGVTHPSAPDTVILSNNADGSSISANDFTPVAEERKTTIDLEETTKPYKTDAPIIQISISSNQQKPNKKPIFRPKPSRPSDNDKYVLVPTITHGNPNKTHEFDAIVNIIQMLNDSSTTMKYGSGSTTSYTFTSTKRPPSTSYVFSLTPTKRPGYDPATTKKLPPSTSYVYSTSAVPVRPTIPPETTTKKKSTVTRVTKPSKITTNKKPSTSTTPYIYPSSSIKPTNYVYSSTFRPTPTKKVPNKSTYANSPGAFQTTKKPLSTSYVYSSTVTKRPTTNSGPTYSVTPSPSVYSSEPSPPPTVIVLAPFETSTPKPQVQQATSVPQRKPVTQITINNHITQNIFSTERPSPTVLITPKPSGSSPFPFDYQTAAVEQENPANDFNNFPPVRNPNLNMSATIYDEDALITTPAFIEDEVLNKKVASFVNKIVQSLQEPFQGLRDVVYSKNKTTVVQSDSTTKKPTKNKVGTTKKPVSKPSNTRPSSVQTRPPTKKPIPTKKPSSTPTRKPTTTVPKRTRPPTRKTTTTTPSYIDEEEEDSEDTSGDFRNQCGVRPMLKSGRIVGGKDATFGGFPWQVLVRESTWLGLFTKNKCGGVLISNRYVITAAHCQPGFLASLVAVFGEFDISGELESKRSISRNVKRVIVHRQYDPATFENDLALLELEHPVQFDSHIVPICLPRDGEDFTGRLATVTGWGRLKYGGGVPSVLQEVQVPIMENHVCQDMFRTAGHSKVIMDSFLCAGYANGQKDSCEGDSGGPLVLQRSDGRYQLAGTVSHGIKCAAPYLPGVYMRTTYYKPWIETVTGLN